MNSPIPEEILEEIKNSLFRGDKIGAIKQYRLHQGTDLRDSKIAVEKIEEELRSSDPGRFTKPQGKGCASLLLAMCVIVAVIWLAC
jgi:hypothetical protein